MTRASAPFWETLFGCRDSQAGDLKVEMRLLRKRGNPFLLLPLKASAAATSLQLYPAQTPRARIAKALLRRSIGMSIPAGTEKVSLTASSADPLVQFLSSQSGDASRGFPAIATLAGNPASDGQRFLILVFNSSQKPVAVIKAGLSERAKTLIEREESLLRALAGKITGIPRIRGVCQSSKLQAIALDFIPGDSPRRRHETAIPSLLSSWVDQNQKLALRETADWKRLEQACPAEDPVFAGIRRTRDWSLHPAIQHGDFAPWNIKVSRAGVWTVLDWERGELTGIPGWDWFHYVLQPAILVEQLRTFGLIQRVEQLLASGPFKQYAGLSEMAGCERELLLAYLLHSEQVIKPSEGLAATRELIRALASRWGVA